MPPPEQRQRIADIKPHRLAATGNRHVQFGLLIGTQIINKTYNLIGRQIVFPRRTDIRQRLTCFPLNHVNTIRIETDSRQSIFRTQAPEKTVLTQQRTDNIFRPRLRGQHMDFFRQPLVLRVQRIKRFGYDLRRHAGYRYQDFLFNIH